MKTIDPDILMAALGEALETMAFIAIEPGTEEPAPAGQLQISLAFSGLVSGQLSLCAPAALGSNIAANLAATEPDAVAPEHSLDALRELANVTAGLVLRQICTIQEMPQLAIPIVSANSTQIDADSCQASISADGHAVTISLRVHT